MIYFSNNYDHQFNWSHSYQALASKYQQLAADYTKAIQLR